MLEHIEQITSSDVDNDFFKRYIPLCFESLILLFVPSESFHKRWVFRLPVLLT